MKHFQYKEFVCKCCGNLPVSARENVEALVQHVLDPVREDYGKPIVVNSGYRCPYHNTETGGARRSQHLKGEAVDIRAAGLVGDDLAIENLEIARAGQTAMAVSADSYGGVNTKKVYLNPRSTGNVTGTVTVPSVPSGGETGSETGGGSNGGNSSTTPGEGD